MQHLQTATIFDIMVQRSHRRRSFRHSRASRASRASRGMGTARVTTWIGIDALLGNNVLTRCAQVRTENFKGPRPSLTLKVTRYTTRTEF